MAEGNYELKQLSMDGPDKNYEYAEFEGDRKLRVVDYVLVYEMKDSEDSNEQHNETGTKEWRREAYEKNLEETGLELERRKGIFCSNACFTLVHAPFDLLMRQAEAMGIKMPFQEDNIQKNERMVKMGCIDRYYDRLKFLKFDEGISKQLEGRHFFTRPFIKERLETYVGHEHHDTFFESAERSRMVYDLLLRTKYGDEKRQSRDKSNKNDREMLYWYWCKQYFKNQPLLLVKKYFGAKIAMYFAWLGFYTMILYPAAILGILCTLYGLFTVNRDIPSNDICASDGIGAEVMMCPNCYLLCSFTSLSASCFYTKVTYVFDNYGTVVFAALMSIFSTLFLELWKRYHADISWKWGLLDFEVDELVVVIAIVFGVIIYRAIVSTVMYRKDDMKRYASFLAFSTAAVINLAVILILSQVYTYIAKKLTDWECHQYQSTYDNSYTLKVYLFQFFNYYSSIFYIAFIKGNISKEPTGGFLGMKPEECDAAGCMVELVIQLAIIMVGKQLWNFFSETYSTKIMNKIRQWQLWIPQTKKNKMELNRLEKRLKMQESTEAKSWEQDYVLTPVTELFLFDEYLEMVIQFGFVSLFVSAFPLAPLFALVNNIFEIRTDAQKYLVDTQRPNPQHAKDIGIWLTILNTISQVAVLSNASIIAFTSDFIPKLVYRTVYNHENLYGYVNNSLSYYDATAIESSTHFVTNITVCRYRDYRYPPCSVVHTDDCAASEYTRTEQWWIVLTFRLVFVLLFVIVISAIKMFIASIIPDMPSRVSKQLHRQRSEVRKQCFTSARRDVSTDYERKPRSRSPDHYEPEKTAETNLSDEISFHSCSEITPSNSVVEHTLRTEEVDAKLTLLFSST
ncbi:unnamed protein product [Anisakis simplex]|uniref:Anoctamin n=1 Tax=Anisakis simplex TaxID=6269 RepID=A0A0M3K819_ANISI|nr:unnamed protein product [Anisakis simplex]